MSNLGSLNKKRRGLVKQLETLQAEIRPKVVEFGILTHTHRTDPVYSVLRFNSLKKNLERLREQEADLRFDLEQIELEINLVKLKSN